MSGDLKAFFDRYNASFGEGPAAIADFYFEPCITARMGQSRLNATRKDTEEFFGQALGKYRGQGFHHGKILGFESRPIGANSALATIQWSYNDASGKSLWQSTFSYNLYKSNGAWKILLQTMHDAQ